MYTQTLSTPAFINNSQRSKELGTSFWNYENIEGSTLKGIELSLFSFQVSLKDYESLLEKVCGTHFQYQILSISEVGAMTVYISPEDYCLIEGGMMYKSAGNIISELVKRGLLIKGMRTIEI